MGLPFAVFLSHLLAGALLALAVVKVPPARKKLLHALAVVSLLGILVKAVLAKVPGAHALFPDSDFLAYAERDMAVPFGVVFFSIAWRLVENERNRRAVLVMPFLLALYLVVANAWTFTTPECYREHRDFWSNGVLLQSTDYTCSAAASATLLRARGDVSATEHEMSALSFTIPNRGVTTADAAMGLRKKLPGRRVQVRRASVGDLATQPLPCLASLNYSFFCDHMVCILALDPRGFVVGDPLLGRIVMTREELEPRWLGEVVTVE
ncbi:hypothetical protein HY251_08850 [bacterium]|nr:hypothetical protein [bacterium]